MDRHGRQSRLVEVGAAGQARIERASLDVRLEGFAAQVAARYLAGAGVARLRVRDAATAEAARAVDPRVEVTIDPTLEAAARQQEDGKTGRGDGRMPKSFPPSRLPVPFNDPVARELAEGAHEALRLLRGVLKEPS